MQVNDKNIAISSFTSSFCTLPEAFRTVISDFKPFAFIFGAFAPNFDNLTFFNHFLTKNKLVLAITYDAPEALMGMTVLAAGGCLPEAISVIIVARKGMLILNIS